MTESLSPILLVEDNPDDEVLIVRTLKRSHISNSISVVRDGAEALDVIFSAKRLPCVVLLDLKLPKIDGLTVLKRLRANDHTRLLPVVILTSSSEESDIMKSYAGGANSYVQKPVDFTQFSDVVSQLGLYWSLINKSFPKDANG
ncbi:MAG: response regulator [Cyanobacteria bacterium P01_A01_bin.137]